MRLLSVILNAPTTHSRFSEATKLLDYGFAGYETVPVLKKNQVIQDKIPISGGKGEMIRGIAPKAMGILIKSGDPKKFEKEILLEKELRAPIDKGQKIGTLKIQQGKKVVQSMDIVSDQKIEKAGFGDYFIKIFNKWVRK